MNDNEKTHLKWKFLFERFKIFFKVQNVSLFYILVVCIAFDFHCVYWNKVLELPEVNALV